MTAVWYDDESDQIWIGDREEPFPPRTLGAYVDESGRIHIHRRFQSKTIAGGNCTEFTNGSGTGFDGPDAAMAYLNEVFERGPSYAGVERVTADEDMGGHRIVRISGAGRAAYASCDDPEHAEFVIGMTRAAIASGTRGLVSTQGVVEEPSWTWEPGPLFLGLSGLLTPNPPTSGFVLRVATVVTPTRVLLVHDEPYLLAS